MMLSPINILPVFVSGQYIKLFCSALLDSDYVVTGLVEIDCEVQKNIKFHFESCINAMQVVTKIKAMGQTVFTGCG
jgi:hypothetical protein